MLIHFQLQEAPKPAPTKTAVPESPVVPATVPTMTTPAVPLQPQAVVPVPMVQAGYPGPGMDMLTQLQLIVQQRTNQIMNDMKNPNLTQIEQFQIYEQLQKLYSISQLLTVNLLQPQNQLTLASVMQSLVSMGNPQVSAPDFTSLMMTLQSQASTPPILSSGIVNSYSMPTMTPTPMQNPFTIQTTPIPSGSSVASQATATTIPTNPSDPWSLENLKR